MPVTVVWSIVLIGFRDVCRLFFSIPSIGRNLHFVCYVQEKLSYVVRMAHNLVGVGVRLKAHVLGRLVPTSIKIQGPTSCYDILYT